MKHRITHSRVMIALIFTLFQATLLHCQETVISTNLAEKMSSAPDSELIRVLVFFKANKEFSPDERLSMNRMTLSGRQFFHATALKEFGDTQSANVKARISEGAKSGKAKLIADLWAAYAISCWAQKDIIEQLGNLPEVREIVWDFDRPSAGLESGRDGAFEGARTNSEARLSPTSTIEWGVAKIGAPQVWNLGYRGAGVIVALLDDGCDYTHPDLAGHLWDGASFSYNGQPVIHHGWDVFDSDNDPNGGSHGTKTAGIIVGDGTGGTQTGVAPDAKLMIISNMREGSSNETKLMAGINWLFDMKTQNATFPYPDVINMSGGMKFDFRPSYQQWRILCKSVFDAGMLIIASVGNEGGGSPGACSRFAPPIGLICSPCVVEVCPSAGNPCGYPIPYAIRTPANVPSPWLHPSQPAPLPTSAPDNHVSSVIACGATDNLDAIAGYSSRGPAAWEDIWNILLHGDGTGFTCQYTISSPYWDYTYHTAIPNNPLIKPDITAPSGVMSTALGGGYVYSDGTSAAAPHVSGTVALMLSANPNLKGNLSRIAQILETTAIDLGASGKDYAYGAGRIDAYQAVLLSLADANKSTTANATTTNSQRKLVRDQATRLHLVFESGNEIFYRKSTSAGTTWSYALRLSDGSTKSSYPSVTERSGYIYATWQKANSTNWDIIYSYSTNSGVNWLATPITLVSSVAMASPGPVPVIMAATYPYTFELLIAYATNTDIKSARTTTLTPAAGNWTTTTVTGASSGSRNPSLAYKTGYPYFSITWDYGAPNSTLYNELYGSLWGSSYTYVTAWLAGHSIYSTINSSYAVSGNGDRHVTTEGTDQSWGVIIHTKNLSQTVYTEFYYQYYRNFYKPVITGNDGSRASLLWYRDDNVIYKTSYNGVTWSAPVSFGSNDKNPIVSINNGPVGGTAYAMWAEGATAPYAITTNSNGGPLQKGSDHWVYSRRVSLVSEDGRTKIRVEMSPPTLSLSDGSVAGVSFKPIDDEGTYDRESIWSAFETIPYQLPATTQSVFHMDYKMIGEETKSFGLLPLTLEVVDANSGTILSQRLVQFPVSDTLTTIDDQLSLAVQIPAGKPVKIRIHPLLSIGDTFKVSVGHIYRELESVSSRESTPSTIAVTQQTGYALMANYPNPFNPATTLSYQLKDEGRVRISIYNVLGQEIALLVDAIHQMGVHSITWNALTEPGGVYYARMIVADDYGNKIYQETKKLILLK